MPYHKNLRMGMWTCHVYLNVWLHLKFSAFELIELKKCLFKTFPWLKGNGPFEFVVWLWYFSACRLFPCSNLILVGLLMKMQFVIILFWFMSCWMVCSWKQVDYSVKSMQYKLIIWSIHVQLDSLINMLLLQTWKCIT